MRTVDARTGIEWLDRDECLRLLAVLTDPVRIPGTFGQIRRESAVSSGG